MPDAPQHENRSSAPTPEQLAAMNTYATKVATDVVTALFGQLMPFLKEMQLTPEKIQALKTPPPDLDAEKRRLRNEREKKRMLKEISEAQRIQNLQQQSCLHRDQQQREAIKLMHNWPDRQVRGICTLCFKVIHPRHWEIIAPTPEGDDVPKLMDADKDYNRVLALESVS